MVNGQTVSVILPKKIEEAKKLRADLDALIESAEILANKRMLKKIKAAEKAYSEGKTVSFKGIHELRKHLGI